MFEEALSFGKNMQLDMIAKIRQFGTFTFFITGSAADFHWPELIQVIAKQYGRDLSKQDIDLMTSQERRNWLARNPVTAARHIDYIFYCLWKHVILSGCHPSDKFLIMTVGKNTRVGVQPFSFCCSR